MIIIFRFRFCGSPEIVFHFFIYHMTEFSINVLMIKLNVYSFCQAPKGWRRLGHHGAINDVCFSPEGVYVASCSSDKTLKVWTTYTGTLLRTLVGHTDAVTSCM